MIYRVLFVLTAIGILGLSARADTIIIRGRDLPAVGNVKSEGAKSVVFTHTDKKKKGDETIPSTEIVDIVYDSISPSALMLPGGAYRIAKDFEKQADKEEGSTRSGTLGKAIASYNETLKKMARDTAREKYAARNLEYKVAILSLKRATDQATTDLAVKRLQEFAQKPANRNSWQINIVMPTIAQVQMDSKDFKEAAKTYQEIAELDVFPAEVRRDAELKVVEITVKVDVNAANKMLDALEKKAAGSPAFTARVKLTRAEVLVGQKQYVKAMPLLQEVVKNNNDKAIKALAHNGLGECLFKEAKYQEALWEFLWVDAVFNQDRNQHAKSLYYLWKTFQQLNNAERAQECYQSLISDRQFNGTEWQRLALKSEK